MRSKTNILTKQVKKFEIFSLFAFHNTHPLICGVGQGGGRAGRVCCLPALFDGDHKQTVVKCLPSVLSQESWYISSVL